MRARFILLTLTLSVGAGALAAQGNVPRRPSVGQELLGQVLGIVAQTAVDSLPMDSLYEKAARGLIAELKDPYAAILSPEEQARFQRQALGNRYAGIGALVRSQNNLVTLFRVYAGSPAARGGLQQGDRILKVGTKEVSGLPVDSVTAQLLGMPNTPVVITYERFPDLLPRTVTVTRGEIRVPAVPFTLMLPDRVGYVPIQRFNSTAAEDVANAVIQLAREGAKSYVLDLRGNGGGDLDAGTAMAGLFLEKGQEVARVNHRGQPPVIYRAGETVTIGQAPIAVLVDGASASAAEIVAGSLQDHDRAVIVGTRSFGKGLVQTQRVLPSGWAIRLTTGKWYTPSGRSIQADHGGLGDERFVEADSIGQRPVFRSDAGRAVLGGGGVTPEVPVKPDSVSAAERTLARALGTRATDFHNAVFEVARWAKPQIREGFTVQRAWHDSLYVKLQGLNLQVPRGDFDAAYTVIDQVLEGQIAGLALGDGEAFRRQVERDVSMQAALQLLRKAQTQKQLLALVGTT